MNSQIKILILQGSLQAVSGLSETVDLIQRIECLDGFVTFCIVGPADPMICKLLRGMPKTVEIFYLDHAVNFQNWLLSRATYYDLVLMQDPTLIGSYTLPTYSSTRSALLRDGHVVLIQASDSMSCMVANAA